MPLLTNLTNRSSLSLTKDSPLPNLTTYPKSPVKTLSLEPNAPSASTRSDRSNRLEWFPVATMVSIWNVLTRGSPSTLSVLSVEQNSTLCFSLHLKIPAEPSMPKLVLFLIIRFKSLWHCTVLFLLCVVSCGAEKCLFWHWVLSEVKPRSGDTGGWRRSFAIFNFCSFGLINCYR